MTEINAVSSALTGATRATARLSRAAETIAGASGEPADIAGAMVGVLGAATDYRASLAVLKAARENDDRLLDIIA